MRAATKRGVRRAAIYRKAAWALEADAPAWHGHAGSPYCCDRIGEAAGWFQRETKWRAHVLFASLRDAFVKRFGPRGSTDIGTVFYGDDTKKNRDARILALCFMAAMVEAGDA